jgi:hypothetical protein
MLGKADGCAIILVSAYLLAKVLPTVGLAGGKRLPPARFCRT